MKENHWMLFQLRGDGVFRKEIIRSRFNCRVNGALQKGIINSWFSLKVDGLS